MIDFSDIIPGTGQCSRLVKQSWYVTVYTYLSFVVYPVIPAVMLSAWNGLIIHIIWKRKKTNINEIKNKANATEVQLTTMLLIVSVMFVILVSPFEIRAMYYYFVERANTPKQFAMYMFVFQVTRHLFLLNYGINFFLYLLSGSKFRRDLMKLCGRKGGEMSSHRSSENRSDSGFASSSAVNYSQRSINDASNYM